MKLEKASMLAAILTVSGAGTAFGGDPTRGMTPRERSDHYQSIGLGGGGFYTPAQLNIQAQLEEYRATQKRQEDQARTNLLNAIVKRQSEQNQKALDGVDERIVKFLRERIENGSADAAYDLGVRYQTGRGVNPDPKEAKKLFGLAASRGNQDAVRWLTTNRFQLAP